MAHSLVHKGGSSPAAPACPSKSGPRVVVVEDVQALAEHRAAWDDLAAHALEPNPFYESWMLTPAWRAFGKGQELLFLFVYLANPANPQAPPRLGGLFPLQRRRYKRVPVLRLWQHLHCFLCTPLLRKDQARECLAALFDWLRGDSRGTALLELNLVAADGPFHRLLTDFLAQRKRLTFLEDSYRRAFWQPREDAETYLRLSLSGGGRQGFRRKRKRLGELGRLEFTALAAAGDVDCWVRQFLDHVLPVCHQLGSLADQNMRSETVRRGNVAGNCKNLTPGFQRQTDRDQ